MALSPYVVLLDRDGERRYTQHQSEEDVCAFFLSLYERSRCLKIEEETDVKRQKGGKKIEVFQYTANEVLDFIDLGVSSVHVLISQTDSMKGTQKYCPCDAEWLKAAVCRFLVKKIEDDEEDV